MLNSRLNAGDSKLERETLIGIKSVQVAIEDLSPEAVSAGLTVGQIKTDVEPRIRKAGIVIVESADAPAVFVNARVMKHNDVSYVYDVRVSLEQPVTTVANTKLILAATWYTATLGYAGSGVIVRGVRDTVGDLVDEFLNAYLSVNPK